MRTFNHGLMMGAILLIVACSTAGCSLIGYAVGSSLDRHKTFIADSISLAAHMDREGVQTDSRSLLEARRLALLLKQAAPGKESKVRLVTHLGSFDGHALTADTVLAVGRQQEDTGREGLLPGEQVTVTLKGSGITPVSGTILRLSDRNIVLRVEGEDRGFSLTTLETISMSGRRVLRDLASPDFSRRLVRVPGFVLWQSSSPLFIPIGEVEQVRVAVPVVRWGIVGAMLVTLGGGIDVTGAVLWEHQGVYLAGAFVLGCVLSAWVSGVL